MRKLVYYFVPIILMSGFLGCANTTKGIGADAKNKWETTKVWSYDLHKLCCNVAKNVAENTKKVAITTTNTATNTAKNTAKNIKYGIKNGIKNSWATIKRWDANFRRNWW